MIMCSTLNEWLLCLAKLSVTSGTRDQGYTLHKEIKWSGIQHGSLGYNALTKANTQTPRQRFNVNMALAEQG